MMNKLPFSMGNHLPTNTFCSFRFTSFLAFAISAEKCLFPWQMAIIAKRYFFIIPPAILATDYRFMLIQHGKGITHHLITPETNISIIRALLWTIFTFIY